ncbi:hypothetical protein FLAG1_04270 [Fusarium langsethiae]|uniref:Uncharacterized protein n=1 Tax=Fusarium langsethiae TaxID=179993 RepID=A0A0M9EZJ6_FUSLA|nr:hypothetical protein FLAG1_04270 [Fusarium langsethiae]
MREGDERQSGWDRAKELDGQPNKALTRVHGSKNSRLGKIQPTVDMDRGVVGTWVLKDAKWSSADGPRRKTCNTGRLPAFEI